jgi:hypothetical protein
VAVELGATTAVAVQAAESGVLNPEPMAAPVVGQEQQAVTVPEQEPPLVVVVADVYYQALVVLELLLIM